MESRPSFCRGLSVGIFLLPLGEPNVKRLLSLRPWHTLCQPCNFLVHQGFWNSNLYCLGRRGDAQVHKNAFHLLSVSQGSHNPLVKSGMVKYSTVTKVSTRRAANRSVSSMAPP